MRIRHSTFDLKFGEQLCIISLLFFSIINPHECAEDQVPIY